MQMLRRGGLRVLCLKAWNHVLHTVECLYTQYSSKAACALTYLLTVGCAQSSFQLLNRLQQQTEGGVGRESSDLTWGIRGV